MCFVCMSVACRHLTLDVYKCKDTLFLQSDKEKTVERSYFTPLPNKTIPHRQVMSALVDIC